MKNLNFRGQGAARNFKGMIFIAVIIASYFFIPNSIVLAGDEAPTSTPEMITATSTPSEQVQTPNAPEPAITPPAPTFATLNVRYENTIIYSGEIALTTTSYHDAKNDLYYDLTGTSTVFSTLVNADTASGNFSITDAAYNHDWDSYYLRCLAIETASSTSACDNWNYTVDGIYPGVGMDKYILKGGEIIYVYFSTPWQITASTSTFAIGATTTLQTWRYQYDNLEDPWTPDGGDLIDISITNPHSTGWWDTFTTVAAITTDSSGRVDYLFTSTGTYFAKITSLDYSKWSNPTIITVSDTPPAAEVATSTASAPTNSGGTPIGDQTISQSEINKAAKKILDYLQSQQDNDGKIIDGGVTDWAIMSFAANGQYASEIKKGEKSLLDFARNYTFTDASDINICASYPRHILALLASGVAKEDAQIQVMSKKILGTECYHNNKFGSDGINDDVFALLALTALNVPAGELIISDLVNTIIKDQTVDGASTWAGWASADITGAAINALAYAKNNGAVVENAFFDRAKNYLKKQQTADGGWGDALSTGWAMMGINSLGDGQVQWNNPSGRNPWHSLTSNLRTEGYYDSSWSPGVIDWFATKHAVPALLGKFWPIILSLPVASPVSAGGGSSVEIISTATTTTTATSTSSVLSKIQFNLTDYLIPSSTEPVVEIINENPKIEIEAVLPAIIEAPKIPEFRTETGEPVIKLKKIEAIDSSLPKIVSTNSQSASEISNDLEFKPAASSTSKLAKDIFSGSIALAGSLGLYLGWRLLQSLV